MNFLVSTGYRTTGRSIIWKLDANSGRLDLFREDQYYEPGERRKDLLYFGMAIVASRVYCGGGTVLSIIDLDGNLVDRREPGFLHDVHDVDIVSEELFCTNTGRDRIEVFDFDLEHKRTVELCGLAPFHRRRLTEKSANSPDSLHANFISSRHGRIYVTHSYTCEQNMCRTVALTVHQKPAHAIGHPPRRNRGTVLDLRAGKILDSGGVVTLDGERVISGLYGAHDGVFSRGKFYVNATHNIETWIYDMAFEPLRKIEYSAGMLIRGLYPLDDATLLLGATRVDPARTASSIYRPVMQARGNDRFDDFSSVKIVDIATGKVVETIRFDPYLGIHPEVYKIIPLEPPCSDHTCHWETQQSEAES